MSDIDEVKIKTDFIRLDDFLKLSGAAKTGGFAKMAVQNGEVAVNGDICKMRGKKLYPGDIVSYGSNKYTVKAGEN